MSTSEVMVANIALSMLGEDPITALTEDTERAKTANLLYAHNRDTVLRAHPWDSVAARAQLSQEATGPIFGFSLKYALPSNFLRLVQFNDGKTPYRIEGKFLLADTSPARIRYVKKEADPNEYDPLLVAAIATRLAHIMALKLTGSLALEATMWDRYQTKMQEARSADAMGGPLEVFEADEWTDARLFNTDVAFRPIESL